MDRRADSDILSVSEARRGGRLVSCIPAPCAVGLSVDCRHLPGCGLPGRGRLGGTARVALRQAIAAAPEGLVVTALQERLDQIAQLAADISQRMTQPEAEDLKSLSREVTQLRKVIHDPEQQFTRASQQVGTLSKAITELNTEIELLAGRQAATGVRA